MNFKCIALDFDNCLAYHDDDLAGLFDIFTSRGFTKDEVEKAYEAVRSKSGFSLENLVSALGEIRGVDIKKDEFLNDFDRWVSHSVKLYSDVEEFLEEIKSMKIPVAIVTFGDKEHQEQKVLATGISYNHLIVTGQIGEKFTSLRGLIERYGTPIAFIDDKPEELDGVREYFTDAEIKLFRIMRPGGRHVDKKSKKFIHPEITDLSEILD